MIMTQTIYFLTQLIGAPVYSGAGRQSGEITDFLLALRGHQLFFEQAIVHDYNSNTNKVVSLKHFKTFTLEKFELEGHLNDLPVYIKDSSKPTAKDLWDKPVIDTVEVKNITINDLAVVCDRNKIIRVYGVDVSLKSALTRLGLFPVAKTVCSWFKVNLKAEVIEWERIIGFDDEFESITTDDTSDNLQNMHPADLADIIEELNDDDRVSVIENLDEDVAAEAIAEADPETQIQIIEDLDTQTASDIIEEMDPDEAADLLQDIDKDRAKEILEHMDLDEASDVRKLLEHDEFTAGGIMTTEYISIYEDFTVANAIAHIRLVAADIDNIYYMYVLDDDDKLKGVVSIREVICANPSELIADIMETDIVTVDASTPQEEAASLISKYDYMALPVVNEKKQIIGVITIDDIVDVMEEEANEDIMKMAGTSDEELDSDSPLQTCKSRLPWLLITLCTGFISSAILKYFMASFESVAVLVFFVPVVCGMGGNAGVQASTLAIRALSLDSEISFMDVVKRLWKETAAGALMGSVCGFIIGVWANFLINNSAKEAAAEAAANAANAIATATADIATATANVASATAEVAASGLATISPITLSFTVGIAMMATMSFSTTYGALVPIVFNKFKIDPAVASGPFVTSCNDIFALLIYYAVVSFLMSMFV